nr:hypothetical protein [Tolypothrix sp. PCC 7601]
MVNDGWLMSVKKYWHYLAEVFNNFPTYILKVFDYIRQTWLNIENQVKLGFSSLHGCEKQVFLCTKTLIDNSFRNTCFFGDVSCRSVHTAVLQHLTALATLLVQ